MADVPNVPGVPALAAFAEDVVTILVADAVSLLFSNATNPWGIFLDGEQAFDFDSMNAFTYRKDYTAADYKVEAPGDGQSSGFMSYDKVESPFEIKVRLISGGTEQEREALIRQVDEACASLNLYDVVTPERLYQNCNPVRPTYERTSENGVGMIKIDITFQEIRSSEASAFSNTQQPGSAGQQGLGNVQSTAISGPGNVTSFPIGDVQ